MTQTTISYQLNRPQKVTLEVYNAAGLLIKRLLTDVPQVPGFYTYSFGTGKDFSAFFIVVLTTEEGVLVEKVM